MIIHGSPDASFLMQPGWRPKTSMAVEWVVAEDGFYRGFDWGVNQDFYEAKIRFVDTQDTLHALRTVLNNGAARISAENAEEQAIFGPEFSWANLEVALKVEPLRKINEKMWQQDVTLRAAFSNMTLTATAELPTLYAEENFTADTVRDLTIHQSMDGTAITVLDGDVDRGIWEGDIMVHSWHDASKLRRWLLSESADGLTRRVKHFWLPAGTLRGVDRPFGYTKLSTEGWWVKCVGWEDLGPPDLDTWSFRLKLVEDRA